MVGLRMKRVKYYTSQNIMIKWNNIRVKIDFYVYTNFSKSTFLEFLI